MPRKGIHPMMHQLKVVLTNGAHVNILSTLKRELPVVLTTDPLNHPAWTGQRRMVEDKGQAAKFFARFGKKV